MEEFKAKSHAVKKMTRRLMRRGYRQEESVESKLKFGSPERGKAAAKEVTQKAEAETARKKNIRRFWQKKKNKEIYRAAKAGGKVSAGGGATASGAMPRANHTIAVDAHNPVVPMGTKIIMNGVEYTVEDTGNFARYGVAFDVYYDSHSATSNHGHQTWEAS